MTQGLNASGKYEQTAPTRRVVQATKPSAPSKPREATRQASSAKHGRPSSAPAHKGALNKLGCPLLRASRATLFLPLVVDTSLTASPAVSHLCSPILLRSREQFDEATQRPRERFFSPQRGAHSERTLATRCVPLRVLAGAALLRVVRGIRWLAETASGGIRKN